MVDLMTWLQPSMTPLGEAESRLRTAAAEFAQAWKNVESDWNDGRRALLERDLIEPLPTMLSQTFAAIAEFRQVAHRGEQVLDDPQRGQ
jgi:hypothetical protein